MTDSQDESRRAAFEQECERLGYCTDRYEDGTYQNPGTDDSWQVWQAGVRWATEREREACCKVTCPYCHVGLDVFTLETGGWFHRDRDGNLITCQAHAIWARRARGKET